MRHIILDTDVGTDADDALALALAAAHPDIRLVGVTTVHADAPLRARIARRLLQLAGHGEVPVVAGASLPLAAPLPDPFHWHPRLWGHEGTGLLSPQELTPTRAVDLDATADDAARFIVEHVTASPRDISLVAIGPLTNIARALRLEPRLSGWARDLTLTGGMVDVTRTPWPPVLETNLNADPSAAEIVFAAGLPLTIVPFEVTTRVFLSPAQRASMRAWKRPLAGALVTLMEEMLARFADFSRAMNLPSDIFQGERTYMHDPLAVYASVASTLIAVRGAHIQLAVHDRVLRTIASPDRAPNMRVCVDVDAPRFVEQWLSQVGRL